MKRYAVFMYIEGAEDRTDNVVAYVEADDPFEACEKAGFPDPSTHFARQIVDMKAENKYVADAEQLVIRLKHQMNKFNEADEVDRKANEFVCPNCGAKLSKNRTCKSCKFGLDELAIGDVIVSKKELDKAVRKFKKQQKSITQSTTP